MNIEPKEVTGEYLAPWEKSFDRILTSFEEFIHQQTTSGLLLMLPTMVLMAWWSKSGRHQVVVFTK